MKVKILQIIPAPEGLVAWKRCIVGGRPATMASQEQPIALALVQELEDPNNIFVDGIGRSGRPYCEMEEWAGAYAGLDWTGPRC